MLPMERKVIITKLFYHSAMIDLIDPVLHQARSDKCPAGLITVLNSHRYDSREQEISGGADDELSRNNNNS
jgi:hypothetical protein